MYLESIIPSLRRFSISLLKQLIRRIPLLIFLLLYLLWVGGTYRDFGISIDEPIEYGFGEMMYNRTFGRDPILLRDFAVEHKDSREIWAYNHFHAMILYVFNDSGSIQIYHLINMIFATFGYIVAYEIVLAVLENSILALVGPVFLLTTPRFFGDVPTNIKDPVFALYYLFSL